MSTSKVGVVGDVAEFDFSRAVSSPFRAEARTGMRLQIVTDGADLPTYHVIASRRGRSSWIEVAEIDGSGGPPDGRRSSRPRDRWSRRRGTSTRRTSTW